MACKANVCSHGVQQWGPCNQNEGELCRFPVATIFPGSRLFEAVPSLLTLSDFIPLWDIDCHFVHDMIECQIIITYYIFLSHSPLQTGDITWYLMDVFTTSRLLLSRSSATLTFYQLFILTLYFLFWQYLFLRTFSRSHSFLYLLLILILTFWYLLIEYRSGSPEKKTGSFPEASVSMNTPLTHAYCLVLYVNLRLFE